MKDKKGYFGEAVLKFEALTETPLKGLFGSIELDRKMELLDGLVIEVKSFATLNNMPYPDRTTWNKYKKTANWEEIAKKALTATLFSRAKASFSNLF